MFFIFMMNTVKNKQVFIKSTSTISCVTNNMRQEAHNSMHCCHVNNQLHHGVRKKARQKVVNFLTRRLQIFDIIINIAGKAPAAA